MALEEITIEEVADGLALVRFNEMLREAVDDLYDRPQLYENREVTLTIQIKPDKDFNDRPRIGVNLKIKKPRLELRQQLGILTPEGKLLIEPQSADARQPTLPLEERDADCVGAGGGPEAGAKPGEVAEPKEENETPDNVRDINAK